MDTHTHYSLMVLRITLVSRLLLRLMTWTFQDQQMLSTYRKVTQRRDQRRRRVSSGSTHRLDSMRVVRMVQLTLTSRLPDRLQPSPRNQPQVTDRPRLSLVSSALLQKVQTTCSCTSTTFTKSQLRTIQYQVPT